MHRNIKGRVVCFGIIFIICLAGLLYSKTWIDLSAKLSTYMYIQSKTYGYKHLGVLAAYLDKTIDVPKTTDKVESTEWTMLMTVNDAFFDFFSNWFFFYSKLKLNLPIVIVAEDEMVEKKLVNVCSYCQIFRSELNLNGTFDFNSEGFAKFVSRRPLHILRLLRQGKNVLYVDVDSVWLKNPLPYFNQSVDFTYQLDNQPDVCTGFLAIKSNNETNKMVDKWREIMESKRRPANDQLGFNPMFQQMKHLINHQPLSSMYFPNGRQYFRLFDEEKRSSVVVVHNNYIKGHDKKLERFKKYGLWSI